MVITTIINLNVELIEAWIADLVHSKSMINNINNAVGSYMILLATTT